MFNGMRIFLAYLAHLLIVHPGLVGFAIRGSTREQTADASLGCCERERAALDAVLRAMAKHPSAHMPTDRNRASLSAAVLECEVRLSDQHVVLT
jgi:hypothetical protein